MVSSLMSQRAHEIRTGNEYETLQLELTYHSVKQTGQEAQKEAFVAHCFTDSYSLPTTCSHFFLGKSLK